MSKHVSVTYGFNGDFSARNAVNAAQLDTQLGNLAAAHNEVVDEVQSLASMRASGSGGGSSGYKRVFDVTQAPYGAVGDGIVNDRVAIQQAVEDASVAGGIVYCPPGTYRMRGSYSGYTQLPLDLFHLNTHHIRLHASNVEIRGAGMGSTIFVTDQTACMFSGMQDGPLANCTFRDMTMKYTGGLVFTGRAHAILWSGNNTLIERCEFVDWSMACFGDAVLGGTTRDNSFVNCKFTWTRGRENIPYASLMESDIQFPCVGLQDFGDRLFVSGCKFNGAVSIAWTTTSPSVPDICREPADGLFVQLQNGLCAIGNRVEANGVEALYYGRPTDTGDNPYPVDIIGNTIDCTRWGWGGTPINFTTYGIFVNGTRAVTITGNTIVNCAVGIAVSKTSAPSCSAAISGNTIVDCSQSIWALTLSDSIIAGNQITSKLVLSANDKLSLNVATFGVLLSTCVNTRVSGNTIRGPITGWDWTTVTLAAAAHTGDTTITVVSATGLQESAEWLLIGYVPGVSLGTPIPISTIVGNVLTVLNGDWSATIPALVNSGTVIRVMRGNPYSISAVYASTPVGCSLNDNTFTGFIQGVYCDTNGDPLIGRDNLFLSQVLAPFSNHYIEYNADASQPTTAVTTSTLSVPTPAVSGGTVINTQGGRPSLTTTSNLNNNACITEEKINTATSATITNTRSIENRYLYTAQDASSAQCVSEIIELDITGATSLALVASWSINIKPAGSNIPAAVLTVEQDGITFGQKIKTGITMPSWGGGLTTITSPTATNPTLFGTDYAPMLIRAGFLSNGQQLQILAGGTTDGQITMVGSNTGRVVYGPGGSDNGIHNHQFTGSVRVNAPASGPGFSLQDGRTSGVATLVAGTKTVTTTGITASSRVALFRQATGGTLGHLSVGAITAGTSFVINSSSGTDTSVIYWVIIEP